jgi:hypothetical protein
LNDHTSFAAIVSGGSFVSWSLTFAATIVAVHVSAVTKSLSGSSVNVVGPPVAVAVCAPLVVQLSVYHEPVTLTGSLNVTVTFASTGTSEAPAAGDRPATDGASSAVPLLRGFGADRAGGVGCRQVDRPAGAGSFLHEVVLARLQREVRQRRDLPRRARRGAVLHRPAVQVRRRGAAVVELDEVVLQGGAAVAAAAVDLTDDDQW